MQQPTTSPPRLRFLRLQRPGHPPVDVESFEHAERALDSFPRPFRLHLTLTATTPVETGGPALKAEIAGDLAPGASIRRWAQRSFAKRGGLLCPWSQTFDEYQRYVSESDPGDTSACRRAAEFIAGTRLEFERERVFADRDLGAQGPLETGALYQGTGAAKTDLFALIGPGTSPSGSLSFVQMQNYEPVTPLDFGTRKPSQVRFLGYGLAPLHVARIEQLDAEREASQRWAAVEHLREATARHATNASRLGQLIPDGMQSVLFACRIEPESGTSQTEPSQAGTRRLVVRETVILGLSRHGRPAPAELTRAAKNFAPTALLSEAGGFDPVISGVGTAIRQDPHGPGWEVRALPVQVALEFHGLASASDPLFQIIDPPASQADAAAQSEIAA